MKQQGYFTLTSQDEAYPCLLKQTIGAPSKLFVLGRVDLLSSRQIAMVGSRNPTPTGREIAYTFAKDLAERGFTITSGLAIGIDGAAHEGALAAGGKTIAVLGTGIDVVYPMRHQKLAEKIIEQGGAIISEFDPGTPARPDNFPRRNRIISGLSLGTVVVEAALRSGSLVTAKYALEQNREVFAVPGSIRNPVSRGCHFLIRDGAKLVESVEDILEELDFKQSDRVENKSVSHKIPLDSIQKKLVECVGFEPTPIDLIVNRSGLNTDTVVSQLVLLELEGCVLAVTGGYVRP